MDVTNSNADAINTYNELAQELAATNDDVTLGKMFGMPCINVNRKAFAGLFQDDMVFKLTGDAHAQALQLDGARLLAVASIFQGGGKPRPYPIRLGAAVVLEAKSIFSQLLCMFKGGKLCKHIMLFPGAIGAEMLCASFACWQC